MDRPENIGDLSWFVLRVAGGRELKAEEELLRKDFPAFCPINIARNRKSRYCRKYELRPLAKFLSYIFLGGERHRIDWEEVFKVSVVKGVLGFGGVPIPVPAKIMQKVFADSGTLVDGVTKIAAGAVVEVIDGPFLGLGRGNKVEEVRNHQAKVLLSIFGNFRSVLLPLEHLQLARLDPTSP